MNYVTKNFLSTLFSRTLEEKPGFLELRLINGKQPPIQHFLPSLDAIDEKVSEALQERNNKGWNVYVSVLPRNVERGDATAVSRVTALWVDIDAKHLTGGKDEALAILHEFPIIPTMIVDSGHGYHAYWKLVQEIDVSDEETAKQVRAALHGLAIHLKGDLAVKDFSRVMRLPGSMNVKQPQNPVPCSLLEEHFHPELAYTLDDFTDYAILPSDIIAEQLSVSEVAVPERFQAVLEMDKHLRDTWEGEGEMPHDNSRSGWDMSLADQLANFDFTPNEIAAILRTYPHGKGPNATKPYLEHTIGKALAAKKQRANEEDNKLSSARKALHAIDSSSAPTDIPVLLHDIIRGLYGVDSLRVEAFLLNDVKTHFDITKEIAKKLFTRTRDIHKRIDEETAAKKRTKNLIRDREVNSGEVKDAVTKISLMPWGLFEIVMAVHISSAIRFNPPLWLLIIGVPSSSKTQMLTLLNDADDSYTLDTLTENAFMSGFVPKDGGETQDLLPKLDGVCFKVKDMTTIFSMNEETVKKLLGDLTSIFDGEYAKFTATRGELRCEALFSMIGCVTPLILNKHHTYTRQLGPRFFFISVPNLTEEQQKAGFKIARASKDERDADIEDARRLASSFCSQKVEQIKREAPKFTFANEILTWLEEASLLLARGRGLVTIERLTFEDSGKEVEYFDVKDKQVEQPWRVYSQLKSLACSLAYLRGRTSVESEDLGTLGNILTSTMPVDRSMILKELIAHAGMSVKELSNQTERSTTAIRATLKEMEALELVDSYINRDAGDTKPPRRYFVAERFALILNAAQPAPEFRVGSQHAKADADVI